MGKRDIQSEILSKLLTAETLRYSEARPENVESDLYNYHLKFLIQKGLVEKNDNGYSLVKHIYLRQN